MKVAAGHDKLILNPHVFDSFSIYFFCGLHRHYSYDYQKCKDNPKSILDIEMVGLFIKLSKRLRLSV